MEHTHRCSSLFSSPQQLETGGTLFSALAEGGVTGSRRFPIRGESQVIGQTGGAIEGAPTRWGTGSQHRLLSNQSTHSAGSRHNGWGCWDTRDDLHHCRAGNTRHRNTPYQRRQAGSSGHHNGHLHVRSLELGTATVSETCVGLIGIHDHQRVLGQCQGKLFQFIGATRTQPNPGSLVEFSG